MRYWMVLTPLLALAAPARADEIRLGGDVAIEGVIVAEDAKSLEVQVSRDGSLFLDRSAVVGVTRSDEAGRRALRERWRQGAAAEREADDKEKAFAEAQKAKGLVLIDGEWLTKEDLRDRRETERLELERERAEAERLAAARPIVVNVSQAVAVSSFLGPQALPRRRGFAGTLAPSPGVRLPSGMFHVPGPGDMYVDLSPHAGFR